MYQEGDRVEVIDLDSVWREAYIIKKYNNDDYGIKFIGWGDKWNERVSIERIKPQYSIIKEWRNDLCVGNIIELRISVSRWCSVLITKIDDETIYLESLEQHSNKSKYILNINNIEDYAKADTHFSIRIQKDIFKNNILVNIAHLNVISRMIDNNDLDSIKNYVNKNPDCIDNYILRASLNNDDIFSYLLDNISNEKLFINNPDINLLCDLLRNNNYGKNFELLLKKGYNPNNTNITNNSPLEMAARRDLIDIVKLLISYGSKVNVVNYNNISPLRMAIYKGLINMTRCLLRNGADPNYGQSCYGISGLYVNNKNKKEIDELLEIYNKNLIIKKSNLPDIILFNIEKFLI
jgi:ankyrin repeat protein